MRPVNKAKPYPSQSTSSPSGTQGKTRIFISAAEPSGDRHAAELILRIRELEPETTFIGVAGPRMQAAGCKPVDDFVGQSAMLLGAARLAGRAWRLIRRTKRMCQEDPPDLAILVDSPALHLPLAKGIKAAGCPVLYYIAPQLWAWAPWRIRRLRRRVDKLATILPFEQDYFRQRGMQADFVGHPLVTQLSENRPDQDLVRQLKSMGQPVIACLPGSRSHVIREVLPGQLEVCAQIASRYPPAVFLFAAAHDSAAQAIRSTLSANNNPKFKYLVKTQKNKEILSAADLALCASGTATLEVAWYRVPTVVMYNGSKWGYRLIGRWLIRTAHLSLVNILAGRRIVPEFMPFYTSTEPIADQALDILANVDRQTTIRRELDEVIRSLGDKDAARQTASLACQLIQKTSL
jgi:lipid-A-disaccharide synthase